MYPLFMESGFKKSIYETYSFFSAITINLAILYVQDLPVIIMEADRRKLLEKPAEITSVTIVSFSLSGSEKQRK